MKHYTYKTSLGRNDVDGNTVLHKAVEANSETIVANIICSLRADTEYGNIKVQINKKNNTSKTAQNLALKNTKVKKLLDEIIENSERYTTEENFSQQLEIDYARILDYSLTIKDEETSLIGAPEQAGVDA